MSATPPPRRLARAEAVLAARVRRIVLVLEDTHDRHNISAALRTCEAFGVQDVHLVLESALPIDINPEVTIEADRWLTIHRHAGAERALQHLRGRGYRICVSQLAADAVPLPELPRDARAAYVFGNERVGVSPLWLEQADARFVIPTSGFTGSLNLSVAVALTFYDRLHGAATPPAGDLSAPEKAELRAAWYKHLAHGSEELERTFRDFAAEPPAPAPTFPRDRRTK